MLFDPLVFLQLSQWQAAEMIGSPMSSKVQDPQRQEPRVRRGGSVDAIAMSVEYVKRCGQL